MFIPSSVIDYHITTKGNVWINGSMGGGVEWTDYGNPYRANNVQNALKHYDRKYKQYLRKYLENK